MIFKVMKKHFKDALTVAKRATAKDGKILMVGKGNELYLYSANANIEIFNYIPLTSTTDGFAVEVDPTVVDKWLDKANREMEFKIVSEEKKGRKVIYLECVEKKDRTQSNELEDGKDYFRDGRILSYKPFKSTETIFSAFNEASKVFQPVSDRRYAEYAKFSDINLFVFDPLFLSVFFFQENLGILEKFGTEGVAIHKDAIDVLVKSVKKPKDVGFFLANNSLLLKEGATVYSLKFASDLKFPDYRSLDSLGKKSFKVNATEINEVLKGIPNNKVNKVVLVSENTDTLKLLTDNVEFGEFVINNPNTVPRSAFRITAIKSFFEGLVGEVEISVSKFNSKTTKDGYLWKYQDNQKSKIMPGIKEAPGF